jgi:hypothetical protein
LVYVDPLFNYGGSATFQWKTLCHMFADTLDELHTMAAMIRLKRVWFQDKRLPHYDLTEGKQKEALRKGAVLVKGRKALLRKFEEIIKLGK